MVFSLTFSRWSFNKRTSHEDLDADRKDLDGRSHEAHILLHMYQNVRAWDVHGIVIDAFTGDRNFRNVSGQGRIRS